VKKSPPSWHLLFWVIICAALWGSAFPGIKFVYSLSGEVDASFRYLFAGLRFFLAGLFVCLLSPSSFRPPDPDRGPFPFRVLIVLTLFQTILQYVFFYEGMARASGVLGSIMTGFGSIWWLVLSPLLLKQPWPDWRSWCAIGVSLIGATVAVYSPQALNGNPWVGGFLFMLAAFAGAIAAVSIRFLPASFSPTSATGISLLAGGFSLICLGHQSLSSIKLFLNPSIGFMTLWLAAVSGLAFSIWNSLIRHHPVIVLAQYRFLIPLSGVIQSALFIPGESISWNTFIGGGLVLIAVYWTSVHLTPSAIPATSINPPPQK
jgi:drug/metabolite transporter (DMT)-like permease